MLPVMENLIHPAKPVVIWLTGLSASGKTTIANHLAERFREISQIPVLLDGDEIRKLSGETGFDEASRKRHNLRVGQMASGFEKEGRVVIVSLISPYADIRKQVRQNCHFFIEVYISTDLELCIRRDPKGLYRKALTGEIAHFTGISSPYEIPENPEIIIDTNNKTVEECSSIIYTYYVHSLTV